MEGLPLAEIPRKKCWGAVAKSRDHQGKGDSEQEEDNEAQ
jgi:hypothetical protein